MQMPNFRIRLHFRPSQCRPLHSAARGGCPPFPPPLNRAAHPGVAELRDDKN